MYRVIIEVVVLPRIGKEQCAVAVAGHWRAWRRAEQFLGSLSHTRKNPASCDSSGRCGGCGWSYCPPRLTWRSAEGPADGGLALVKVRTVSEGRPYACRGSCSRGSMRSWQHRGESSVRHVRP